MWNKGKINLQAKPLDSLSRCTLCNCNPYQKLPMLTNALDKQLIKLSELEVELACRPRTPPTRIALPLPFGLLSTSPHHDPHSDGLKCGPWLSLLMIRGSFTTLGVCEVQSLYCYTETSQFESRQWWSHRFDNIWRYLVHSTLYVGSAWLSSTFRWHQCLNSWTILVTWLKDVAERHHFVEENTWYKQTTAF